MTFILHIFPAPSVTKQKKSAGDSLLQAGYQRLIAHSRLSHLH